MRAFACVLTGAAALSSGAQEVAGTEPNRGGTVSVEARDPEYALKHLFPAEGYEVNLFASEKDFPIGNPVALNFDGQGRMWVLTMPSYPQRLPDVEPDDGIVILEDRNRDGVADSSSVFAGGLHVPTGFELGDGGVYVATQPNLSFLKDTDGDGKADFSEVILHGFGTEDSHHSISAFTWGPDGGLYFQEGTFHHSQVETPFGPTRLVDSGVFRYYPPLFNLEVFVSYRFANPWGHVFDRWGQNFVADASGGSNYVGAAFSGFKRYPDKSGGMKVFTTVVRPTSGCEIVSSRHFPDEAQGNFLINNVIGFQGIKQHRVLDEGSGFTSEELEPLLYSDDINFRPVDIEFGPDGALYIVDWFNPLIGHMQYSIRDPGRDHGHGRIWRITYKNKPLLEPVVIAGRSAPDLLELLKTYEDRVRYRARIELRNHPRDVVSKALAEWVAGLDPAHPDYQHHLLEALWVYQTIHVHEPTLLERVLQSPDYRARAAAVRVVRHWRDLHPDAAIVLRRMIDDEHPRVRLETIVALSYMPGAASAQSALAALNHETDYYIEYALKETVQTLQPYWQPALADGSLYGRITPAAADYLIARVPTDDLAAFSPSEPVYQALLDRTGVAMETRYAAAIGLARMRNTEPLAVVLDALNAADARGSDGEDIARDLGALLARESAGSLRSNLGALESIAATARTAAARRHAIAARIRAEGTIEGAWEAAQGSPERLVDFVESMQYVPEGIMRDAAYPRVAALVETLPEGMAAAGPAGVRYVRIALNGDRRVLTLAEVEAVANGSNAAPGGTARQSSTAFDGAAERAIDGNTNGVYVAGSQTHTEEEANPWWEVDLGAEAPVSLVRVFNRTEGDLGTRLDGFVVSAYDGNRRLLFESEAQKAQRTVEVPVMADPHRRVRLAAIDAISRFPERSGEAFATLAAVLAEGDAPEAAAEALLRLPNSAWSAERAPAMSAALLAYVKTLPASSLSSEPVQRVFAVGERLAALMPANEGGEVRAALANLGITVITIRPIPHKMLYDRKEFVVRAGAAAEVVFENTDIMPHNLVIGAMGSLSIIGKASDAIAMDSGAPARHYVPDVAEVLYATKLLNPGQSERLTFVAPTEPGDYPFVCTYPGHWLLMNGVMRVVEDIDPEMLAKANAEVIPTDEGKVRTIVKDWTFADLAPGLATVNHHRNFHIGQEMFVVAGCVQCHQLQGAGAAVGPDLTKIGEKYTKLEDLLTHILEPSKLVEEDYVAYRIDTTDLETYSGIIAEQNDAVVRIRANPLDPNDILDIPRENIETMEKVAASTMPSGLLVTLQQNEIYDLLAYLAAGGDESNPAFSHQH